MFTILIAAVVDVATFTGIAAADNLVLYYPVYPQYVVPRHLQNFERNAPPRVYAKNPDLPSSGIVWLNKNLKGDAIDWKARPESEKLTTTGSSRQRIDSDRSGTTPDQAFVSAVTPIIAPESVRHKYLNFLLIH
ncbi:unnamed protein product [Gongylonema pulchrum]|uniref:Secreted protein n=1 Tax=Gongylonema pulchrum TaxID=637853 RepID=A0A183D5G5_9BILA|nr:unnamed protein product [Gongylonema pulchrum]